MVRVRKLGRRVLKRGSFLSDEPEWRDKQLRFLAIGIFFVGCFLLLAHQKFLRLFGEGIVYGVEAVLLAGVIAFVVAQVRASRRPEVEPVDEEFELAPVQVEERLAAGTLLPRDLVQEGIVWRSLGDSALFAVACEAPLAKQRARERMFLAVQIVIGLAIFSLIGGFFFGFVEIMHWLTHD